MALQDYAEIDEDDYYGQNFEEEGKVSIWFGFTTDENDPDNLDVLQDLCGVGYYDLDKQDMNCFDFELSSPRKLLKDLSYSNSFIEQVLEETNSKGYKEARWVLAQYDFNYEPSKVKRKIEADPIFVGTYNYWEL